MEQAVPGAKAHTAAWGQITAHKQELVMLKSLPGIQNSPSILLVEVSTSKHSSWLTVQIS